MTDCRMMVYYADGDGATPGEMRVALTTPEGSQDIPASEALYEGTIEDLDQVLRAAKKVIAKAALETAKAALAVLEGQ